MRRSCRVYLRRNEILVVSAAMTTHGFEIDDEPVSRLIKGFDDVGDAVLRALSVYRSRVTPPGPEGRQQDPILRFAGVKTWGQLERTSRSLFVEEDAGSICIVPTRHSPEGGYEHLNQLKVCCRALPEEIRAAIREAAQLCD